MSIFTQYFSARQILGYKALFNLVLSDRSDGKTFNCKVRALEDYEKAKETTVYVRRYDTEITPKMYNSFMDEVFQVEKYAHYAQKYDFKHGKAGVQIRRKGAAKDEPYDWLFYFVPLSKAGKLKSQLDITNIRTIDYDEFMPLDHRYLKDEMILLMELWKSIDRDRDRTQCILLGNRIDPYCPFFDFFGIELDIEKPKVKLYRSGTVAVQIYVNEEHRAVRSESKFSNAIRGTAYQDYEEGGILYKLNYQIASVPEGAQPLYSFITPIAQGSILLHDDKMYISSKIRNDLPVLVSDMSLARADDKTYQHANKMSNVLRHYYYSNRLVFTSKNLIHATMPLLSAR